MRLARLEDAAEIDALMKASIAANFPAFHTEAETRSAVEEIGRVDLTLIEDGTFFVHEEDGEIVACGGWSRRKKLYTGSGDAQDDGRLLVPGEEPARVRAMFVRGDWTRRGLGRAIIDACEEAARAEGFTTLALMATLPGEQLYRACGFQETGRTMITLADGTKLAGVAMERPIA